MSSDPPLAWPPPEGRVLLTLLSDQNDAPLSPFFAWAPWLAVADVRGKRHALLKNPASDADAVARRILACEPRVLITGFVPALAYQRLIAAGIDVRIGPCSVPALSLVSHFRGLPSAELESAGAIPPRQASHPV